MQRSTLNLYMDILKVTKDKPLIITHVMYKSNITFSVLVKYLEKLVELKLVEKISYNNKVMYHTTSAGSQVLKQYQLIDLLFNADKKLDYLVVH